MKKTSVTVISAILLAALLVTACVPGEKGEVRKDCLRLHVVANSDSPEDQAVKLKVRDAILDCVREDFSAQTKDEAKHELMALGGKLQETVEKTLDENGVGYGAVLMAGSFEFPDRTYDGELYPAGEYDALRVVLGSGEGHNWWCVMFPPLCLVGQEEPEYNDNGTLTFKSFIWDFIRGVFGL